MNAERWQRVRSLFDAVVDFPPSQWLSQLQQACPDDADIRAEALAMLQADATTRELTGLAGRAPDLLDRYAAEADAREDDAWLDRRLGPWRLAQALGRGGMGRVYLAERDDDAYRQQAAVKLVRTGVDHEEILRRFRTERQILASLQHPHIAHLLDGGVTEEGIPWFALDYINGTSLTGWCDRHRLGVPQRLRLFLDVCAAVAYAHERLIVHRDLKPGNILVDAEGNLKLLDFGIARLLDSDATGATSATGLAMFTPEYAAPEQIRGEPATTAVDIHALGVILCELLTGRRPYRSSNTTPAALVHAILTCEPERPSRLLANGPAAPDAANANAARRGLSPERLRTTISGDLDAIVLKAVRKEPEQRYRTVRELAGDVQAVLDHRPVAARQGGLRYQASRFLKRHAMPVAFAAAAVLALIGGLATALWQAREARLQRDAAHVEAVKSRRVVDFLNNVFRVADPRASTAGNVTAKELLAQAGDRIRQELVDEPDVRGELVAVIGRAQIGVGLYEDALSLLKSAHGDAGDGPTRNASLLLAEAEALTNLGRYREALDVLAGIERGIDLDDPAHRRIAADHAYQRGVALRALDELDAADAAYGKAIELRLAVLGPDAHETTEAQMGRSILLTKLGRYREAKDLAEEVLARLRSQADTPPLRLASAIGALAIVLDNLNEDEQAEALMRERLALYREDIGTAHPGTADAISGLGNMMYERQRFAEAETLYREALDHLSGLVGPEHPSIATYENNLGNAILAQGRLAEARAHLEHAYDIRLRHYGKEHNTVAQSLHGLGVVDMRLGRLDLAEEQLAEAVRVQEKVFGAGHFYSLLIRGDLALAKFLAGTVSEGCDALAIATSALAPADENAAAVYVRTLQAKCTGHEAAHPRTDPVPAELLESLRSHFGKDSFRVLTVTRLLSQR